MSFTAKMSHTHNLHAGIPCNHGPIQNAKNAVIAEAAGRPQDVDTRHWPAHTRAWRALRLTCVQSEIAREEATVAATWAPRKEATLYLRGAVCGTVRELQAEAAMGNARDCRVRGSAGEN